MSNKRPKLEEDEERIEEECDEDDDEDEQEKEEKHTAWKEEAIPALYAFVSSSRLEVDCPLMDVDWLREDQVSDPVGIGGSLKGTRQRLVTGTNTEGENYLLLLQTVVPYESLGAMLGTDPRVRKGRSSTTVLRKFKHLAEVRRCLQMPQKCNIVATRASSGDTALFDIDGEQDSHFKLLKGHTTEGFGLDWNTRRAGHLATGGYDKLVLLWDVECGTTPTATLRGHTAEVGGVSWSYHNEALLASCGDDQHLLLWDTRAQSTVQTAFLESGKSESPFGVGYVAFNPSVEHLLLTGDTHGQVKVHDARRLGETLLTIPCGAEVTALKWMPHVGDADSLFLVGLQDGRVEVYDLQQYGIENSSGGKGHSTLISTHYGHMSQVEGVATAPTSEYPLAGCVASVEGDGIIQVWKFNDETLDIPHGLYDEGALIDANLFEVV
eukprot:Sspe_Gene.106467::Locus_84548_Transcript_1_1_Confidence_1.000_Length_1852::g.106467::m.106467